MKIALIRGAFLNPFELQLFEPLLTQHSILAVGANWQFYPDTSYWAGELARLPVTGGFLGHRNDRLGTFWNKVSSALTGSSYALSDLPARIAQSDILHCAESFFTMSYQSLQVKRKTDRPLIVTVSENLDHSGETHPFRKQRKMEVLQEADAFVAITSKTRDLLLREGVPEKRIRVIPMSISLERFKPGARDPRYLQRLRLTEADFVVLFVGRFIAEKGVSDILDIVPRLLTEAPHIPWRFCFLGEGPLKNKIQEAAQRYPDAIRLHPFVPYKEVSHFHRLANLLVLPSKPGPKISEQFGFVLPEAMACGIPVVTTQCGSIPDVVGQAAVVLPFGRPRELAEALIDLARYPEKRKELSEKGRERVLALYDAKKNAVLLETLYGEVLLEAKGS